ASDALGLLCYDGSSRGPRPRLVLAPVVLRDRDARPGDPPRPAGFDGCRDRGRGPWGGTDAGTAARHTGGRNDGRAHAAGRAMARGAHTTGAARRGAGLTCRDRSAAVVPRRAA